MRNFVKAVLMGAAIGVLLLMTGLFVAHKAGAQPVIALDTHGQPRYTTTEDYKRLLQAEIDKGTPRGSTDKYGIPREPDLAVIRAALMQQELRNSVYACFHTGLKARLRQTLEQDRYDLLSAEGQQELLDECRAIWWTQFLASN